MKHNCLDCSKEWECKTDNCRVPLDILCSKCATRKDLMSIVRGTHPVGCHIAIQNKLCPAETKY